MSTKPIVLITGVSRDEGIGYGIARKMVSTGFQVVISARALGKAETLARKLSGASNEVIALQLDVTSDNSVTKAAEFIRQRFGHLDILINNAGGGFDYNIEPLSTDFNTVREALEINLFGAWRVIRIMRDLLRASNKPRIVNISSGAGSSAHPVFGMGVHPAIMTAYSLSKLALNGFTVKLARELEKDKIVITAVNPGFVATAPGMEKMGARSVEDSVGGIIWAATVDDTSMSGKFFEDKKEIGW